MIFNKKEFQKVEDKKVLKKVKKQWITVSVSTLAVLGTTGFTLDSNGILTHASDNISSSESSSNSVDSSVVNHNSDHGSDSSSESSASSDDESSTNSNDNSTTIKSSASDSHHDETKANINLVSGESSVSKDSTVNSSSLSTESNESDSVKNAVSSGNSDSQVKADGINSDYAKDALNEQKSGATNSSSNANQSAGSSMNSSMASSTSNTSMSSSSGVAGSSFSSMDSASEKSFNDFVKKYISANNMNNLSLSEINSLYRTSLVANNNASNVQNTGGAGSDTDFNAYWGNEPAKDVLPDGKQYITYQITNVFYINRGGQTSTYLVPGKTSVTLTPHGSRNTVYVSVMGADGKQKEIGRNLTEKDASYTQVIPESVQGATESAAAPTLSYISNRNAGDGASGKPLSYTPDTMYKYISVYDVTKLIQSQIDAANRNLKDVYNNTTTQIKDDNTLTSDEHKNQSDNATTAFSNGQNSINQALDTDSINKAYSDGKTAIENTHKTGAPLDQQKAAANGVLNTNYNDAINKVNNDNTLTSKEKQDQISQIKNANDNAQAVINSAGSADVINSSRDTGNKNMGSVYHAGLPISDQINNALNDLKNTFDKTNNDIQNDNTLTSTEKGTQKSAVNQMNETAKQAINNAKNADEINKAVSDGQTNISDQHQTKASVTDQQKAAKDKLQQDSEAAQKVINDDVTLTTDQKNTQTNAVINATQVAQDKVRVAQNADDINSAQNDGETSINGIHKNGDSLEKRRTDAN
ncbi:DUF1542 domain-containing protein, partial [Apilactobacillus sp. TMW 2.2459]|uniref:DUF1542 domain-containing protein n=1 Tax=Apilactobacillus xinyiensis TaxID=2841032 RepID=UPI00200EE090